jgi:hypothetical protein
MYLILILMIDHVRGCFVLLLGRSRAASVVLQRRPGGTNVAHALVALLPLRRWLLLLLLLAWRTSDCSQGDACGCCDGSNAVVAAASACRASSTCARHLRPAPSLLQQDGVRRRRGQAAVPK